MNNDIVYIRNEKLNKKFIWCIEKLTNLKNCSDIKDLEKYKETIEDFVIYQVKKHPELLYAKYVSNKDSWEDKTIADLALENKMYKLLSVVCSGKACLVNGFGYHNIIERMISKLYKDIDDNVEKQIIVKIILTALKDNEVATYKNSAGKNFGMIAFYYLNVSPELKPVVQFYIKDTNLALMQDNHGFNLGMMCACCKNDELFEKAYQNMDARKQVAKKGESMFQIAVGNGLLKDTIVSSSCLLSDNESAYYQLEKK